MGEGKKGRTKRARSGTGNGGWGKYRSSQPRQAGGDHQPRRGGNKTKRGGKKREGDGGRSEGVGTYPSCRVACEGARHERRGRAGGRAGVQVHRAPALFDSRNVEVCVCACECVLMGGGMGGWRESESVSDDDA